MTDQIRLKINQQPALRCKVLPGFAGSVAATSPITVASGGGIYTIGLGLAALVTSLNAYYQPLVIFTSTDNAIARFDGTAGSIQNSGVTVDDDNQINGKSAWFTKAVTAVPSDAGGTTPSVNLHRITSDNVDAGTGFIIGHQRRYVFGGSAVKGGRISGYDFVANTAATNSANTNRNYVAHVGFAYTAVGDGGTDTGSGAKGAYFGGNPSVHLDSGALNVFEACGEEFDVTISAGASVRYARGVSIVGFHAARGVDIDCGLSISGGTGHIGYKHGLLFTDANRSTTETPFYASSTIMGTYWQQSVPTVANGIDFGDGSTTGFNFSGNAFRSKGFAVDGTGNVTGTGAGLGKVTPWNGGYAAGRYYSIINGGPGTGSFIVNTAYFTPFVVGETHTFDRIAIEVTATGTAVNGRVAIYNMANGVPTSLVVDGGTMAVGTTGTKTVTISQSLAPGVYALAMVFDGGLTITTIANTQMGTWFYWGTSSLAGASIDSLVAATMTFGAFPVTAFTGAMGAITYTAFVSPLIALRA